MSLWNQSHLWWDMDSGLEPIQTLGQWELLSTVPLEWSLKEMNPAVQGMENMEIPIEDLL